MENPTTCTGTPNKPECQRTPTHFFRFVTGVYGFCERCYPEAERDCKRKTGMRMEEASAFARRRVS